MASLAYRVLLEQLEAGQNLMGVEQNLAGAGGSRMESYELE